MGITAEGWDYIKAWARAKEEHYELTKPPECHSGGNAIKAFAKQIEKDSDWQFVWKNCGYEQRVYFHREHSIVMITQGKGWDWLTLNLVGVHPSYRNQGRFRATMNAITEVIRAEKLTIFGEANQMDIYLKSFTKDYWDEIRKYQVENETHTVHEDNRYGHAISYPKSEMNMKWRDKLIQSFGFQLQPNSETKLILKV